MNSKKSKTGPEEAEDQNEVAGESAERSSPFFIDRLYGPNVKWLIVAILVLGCVAIYFQTGNFGFVNFDDGDYVYLNPHVLSGLSPENISWAFSTFFAANWHPLTWLSLETLSSIFGPSPKAFHLANLALHVFDSVFLYFLTLRLSNSTWKSALIAAIFAFHPAHVESVAWISEHKDVLSTAFWLLTCWFYVSYVKEKRSRLYYVLAVLAFGLGLMAKPMLVTLPFVLLLLDYWPLERITEFNRKQLQAVIFEKIPFFFLVIASSMLTFQAQKAGGAVVELNNISLNDRISNALISYVWYIATFFYPVNLGGWYPLSNEGSPVWQVLFSAVVLLIVSLYVLYEWKTQEYLVTGWFWFLGTLVPVIGLVQVGWQSHADRYTYVPYIGLSIAIVWLAAKIVEQLKINVNLAGAIVSGALIVIGILSFRQVSVWSNSETFYQHTLAITSRNFLFEQNYCQYLSDLGRLDEAEVQCRNSIANDPQYANAWNSLGIIQMKRSNFGEAAQSFEKASRLRPANLEMFSNYINALIGGGRLSEAENKVGLIASSNTAPETSAAFLFPLYRALGLAFAQKDDKEKAIDNFQKANAINSESDEIHKDLGLLLYATGRQDEALAELDRSLELNPKQADIQNASGRILLSQGKRDDAIRRFESALSIDPNMQSAADGLKAAKAEK